MGKVATAESLMELGREIERLAGNIAPGSRKGILQREWDQEADLEELQDIEKAYLQADRQHKLGGFIHAILPRPEYPNGLALLVRYSINGIRTVLTADDIAEMRKNQCPKRK